MNHNHPNGSALSTGVSRRMAERVLTAAVGQRGRLAVGLIAMLVAIGCASTQVTRNPIATGHLARPDRIWVYDFVATPAELPADSALLAQIAPGETPQTPEQVEHARKLGARIATELVALVRDMEMPAERAVAGSTPKLHDIVIRGCLVSFDEGDAKKRMRVGFGTGASEVNAAAEGLQVTEQGLRRLGSGTADAGGSKSPGTALGLLGFAATKNPAGLIISGVAKRRGEKTGSSLVEGRAKQIAQEIADVLQERFQQQGWAP